MAEIIVEDLSHVYSAGTPFEKTAIEHIDLRIPQVVSAFSFKKLKPSHAQRIGRCHETACGFSRASGEHGDLSAFRRQQYDPFIIIKSRDSFQDHPCHLNIFAHKIIFYESMPSDT